MYTYVRAVALPVGIMPQWKAVDVAETAVATLYRDYRRVVVVVTQDSDTAEKIIDLTQLKTTYAAYMNVLRVLLASLNVSLDTLDTLPTETIKYAHYTDNRRVGYSAMLAEAGYIHPENYPRSDLPDIELTRPGYDTDLSQIHKYCLVSINGFFHNTDTDGTQCWIKDGGKTARITGLPIVGMTSFMDIGLLTKRSIDIKSIVAKDAQQPLKSGVQFSIPDSVEGKSFFLVLGGYLVFPEDGVFYPSGEHEYQLNLNRLPYLERILESKSYLDLSGLGLTISEINKDNINLEELWSDTIIKKYLTLSQSFFVVVDADNLHTRKIPLRQMNTPGVFTAYQDPAYPLMVAYGRCCEYWSVYEEGVWSVTTTDSYQRHYIFDRQRQATLTNVTPQLACDKPFRHSAGVLLEIGSAKEA